MYSLCFSQNKFCSTVFPQISVPGGKVLKRGKCLFHGKAVHIKFQNVFIESAIMICSLVSYFRCLFETVR